MANDIDLNANRILAAKWFLCGTGIEIGALHNPLPLPAKAKVKYVDRFSATDLRIQYPELNDLPLIDPDLIDDGEKLESVGAASQDFIVASHFLEHCENPAGALQSFSRVLRPQGILFLVVPDKRFTFDRGRQSTPLEHILRDYNEGPAWSRTEHFREYAALVDGVPGEAVELRAKYLMDLNYSIHFHVWTKCEVLALLCELNRQLGLGYELRLFLDNGPEGIYVLAKTEGGEPARLCGAIPEQEILPQVPTAEPAPSSVWMRLRGRLWT